MKNSNKLWAMFGFGFLVATIIFIKFNSDMHSGISKRQPTTVCGHIASTYYGPEFKDGLTFLNMEKPYPDQTFTGVIWQKDRANFSDAPEKAYLAKNICITGQVTQHKGRPEMDISSESQITMRW